MPRYFVTFPIRGVVEMSVEAESQQDAIDKAAELAGDGHIADWDVVHEEGTARKIGDET